MANEITKTIWGGSISNDAAVEGTTAMRQHANARLDAGSPDKVSSTDISRASGALITLAQSVPSDDAKSALTNSVGSSNLTTTLDTFLDMYSKIRIFTYHQSRTSWGTGNPYAVVPDYTRRGYKVDPAVTTPNDTAPVGTYDDLQDGDLVVLTNYQTVINTLNSIITTNSDKTDDTITYCHSSCHSNCHGSRGRR